MLSSSYTATWSCLRTSAWRQSSESVGQIVSEETCSFGVRSGFQTFFQKKFQRPLPNFSKEFGKIGFGKKFGKKWFSPETTTLCSVASFWAHQDNKAAGSNQDLIIAAVVGTVICLAAAASLAAAAALGCKCFRRQSHKSVTEARSHLLLITVELSGGEVATAALVVAATAESNEHSVVLVNQNIIENHNSNPLLDEQSHKGHVSGDLVFVAGNFSEPTYESGLHSDSNHRMTEQNMSSKCRVEPASLAWSDVEYLWGRKPVTEVDSVKASTSTFTQQVVSNEQHQLNSPKTFVVSSISVPWQEQPAAPLCHASVVDF
jgi:hypothetical protein